MKTARSYCVVLVTAPDLKIARRLASSALGQKLVACANLVPRVESHYWWQGKLERASEVLILFKTMRSRAAALEKLIRQEHPYETPEILVGPLEQGAGSYLDWIKDSIHG